MDILATVGTLFGVATSLGLGSMQINAGLQRLFDWPVNSSVQVGLIAVITLIATISVVTGIKGGIRALSTFNIVLATAILLFVLVAGPTIYVLELFVTSLGVYVQTLPETSFMVFPGERAGWQAEWTLFYWSWWISWSPFVGIFVARISRGRTIREFILTVLLVPGLASFFWFSVIGGTGLNLESQGISTVLEAALDDVQGSSLYAVLGELPWSTFTNAAAILLVCVFFITSSDSGSFVDDMVTSGGDPHPWKPFRVFWTVAEGTVAATLLLLGGLQALRSASLATGLPISIFLLVACYGLIKALAKERLDERHKGQS